MSVARWRWTSFAQKWAPEDRFGQRLFGEHAVVTIFALGSELIGNNLANLADARDPAHFV